MKETPEHNECVAKLTFASVYSHYVAKVERKGRSVAELNEAIEWLTGFDEKMLQVFIAEKVSFEVFFERAKLHQNASLINGVICGYRIEEIEKSIIFLQLEILKR